MASVATARYGPLIRDTGTPITSPTARHTAAAIGSVARMLQSWSATRITVVYAPSPTNADCPSANWPDMPITRSSPRMATA